VRLEVTRKSNLAVLALSALGEFDHRVKGPWIADQIGATPAFTSQVLAPLVKAGWVRSDPGPTGGYRLIEPLDRISVLDVIEAIEGPTANGRCVVADRPCDEAGLCALHGPWTRARIELLRGLDGVSVADAASGGTLDDRAS